MLDHPVSLMKQSALKLWESLKLKVIINLSVSELNKIIDWINYSLMN